MAEIRKEFGALPPSSTAISNSLLEQIRDRLSGLSKLSDLLAVLQSSLSQQNTSRISLTQITQAGELTASRVEEVKSRVDAVIINLSSIISFVSNLDVDLSTRASEATLATRASEITLQSLQTNIEEMRQIAAGVSYLRIQDLENRAVLNKSLEALNKIETHLSLLFSDEGLTQLTITRTV